MKRKKLVQFGAGNIGRSFIGQLFSRAGYEVVFIDVNKELIRLLNKQNQYKVIVKNNNLSEHTIVVKNVRAIEGKSIQKVAEEIQSATYLSTSVGKDALPKILPSIAEGLKLRNENKSTSSVDIIIAENIRNSSALIRECLEKLLPEGFDIDGTVGLVETSIGKMVPIMKNHDLKADPLQVFAEAYNTLIVDKNGFINAVPELSEIMAVNNIQAYVDRKSFIHNLGHAATAYLGFQYNPRFKYIWEVLEVPEIKSKVRNAMEQAAQALIAEYPSDFTSTDLKLHIDNLLERFQNRALEDTIYRVGKDLKRKLANDDRLIGAINLARKHNLSHFYISEIAKAAFLFYAKDENGLIFPPDIVFRNEMLESLLIERFKK
jgi:mannitol-1-phosphate 5-dehydrogenase